MVLAALHTLNIWLATQIIISVESQRPLKADKLLGWVFGFWRGINLDNNIGSHVGTQRRNWYCEAVSNLVDLFSHWHLLEFLSFRILPTTTIQLAVQGKADK